jgi:hypothetical protein
VNLVPRFLLLAASLGALAVCAAAVAAPPYRVSRQVSVPAGRSGQEVRVKAAPESLMNLVVSWAPFRASRTPPAVAFEPDREFAPAREVPQVPKPQLALTGIVWEPEASAVIEGIPGSEGAVVVRTGELAGGWRVRRIERNRVVIAGLDTVWVLTVKEPWK